MNRKLKRRFTFSRILLISFASLFLFTACNSATNTAVSTSVPTQASAPTVAPTTGQTTAPVATTAPVSTTAPIRPTTVAATPLPTAFTKTDTPVDLLNAYYNALSRKDYERAYKYWRDGSTQRATSAQEFAGGFSGTIKLTAEFGAPVTEGAAGTIYANVPAITFETSFDGQQRVFCGKYVLSRTNDVPGATPEQLSWRIFRVETPRLNSNPQPGSPEAASFLKNECKSGIATTNPTAAPASNAAIRQTKWLEVMKADPAFLVENIPLGDQSLHFTLKTSKEVYGYPVLDNIVYVDMDGDGSEEAAFPFFSGGTAGNIAFVVYKSASPAPKLTAWSSGYKLGLKNEGGKLVATNALYVGWEPNCCASGTSLVTYALKNNKLETVATRTEGYAEAQPLTVEHFYQLINNKQLDEAYKLLSTNYQKANPFNTWSAGFANTVKVEVETALVNNLVQIKLTSVDKGNVTKNFSGTWKLEWAGEKGWLLSEPNIKEAGNISAPAKGQVLAIFQPVLAKLKSGNFPVYLPTYIEGFSGNEKLYANVVQVSAKGYEVILGFSPDCGGGTACRLGTLYAEVVGANAQPLTGKTVNLTEGVTGYFTDYTCGANCSDATVAWQTGNVRYTVGVKAAAVESLVKMANSAITNGKL
jgi:hypothetical protein